MSLAACGGGAHEATTGPPPVRADSIVAFPGFDIGVYPGDAALRAWKYPTSPYRWVGYYFLAPCHRDGTWMGTYASVTTIGWGVAAIYVGQQDWTQIPSAVATARASAASAVPPRLMPNLARGGQSTLLVTCSATLLSTAQGSSEATDAIAKARGEGFPDQSVIFLDIEYVTNVTPALLDYYRAWVGGLLTDGHYRPGVYAAKSNAQTLYQAALDLYRAAGRTDTPPFWIASSVGFNLSRRPADVGFDFAQLWQGAFDVTQSWGGISLTIDVDLANKQSPSRD